MKAQLDSISASAERFWAARNRRERIALALAASVLLVTLYIGLLIVFVALYPLVL